MKNRNYCLDSLKAIAALMVICLHTAYPDGMIGGCIKTVARAGVPFFFMVSGYYGWSDQYVSKRKRINALKKHLIIWSAVCGVYFFIYAIPDLIHFRVPEILNELLSAKWLLCNYGFAGHMWFMRALIYIDVFFLLFEKQIIKINLKWLLVIIWLLDVIIFKYSVAICGFVISQPLNEVITKYLCNAFLYYFVGYSIRRGQIRVVFSKYSFTIQISAVLFFAGLSIIEYLVLENYSVNTMPVNYLFTMPFAICLFLLGINHSEKGKNGILSWIGVNASMYIYYWHPLIIKVVKYIVPTDTIPFVNNPISIFVMALFVGFLIIAIKKFGNKALISIKVNSK